MLILCKEYSSYIELSIDDMYDDEVIKDTESEIKNIVWSGGFNDVLNFISELQISKNNIEELSENLIYELIDTYREDIESDGINNNEIMEHFNSGIDNRFSNIHFSNDNKYIYYEMEDEPSSNNNTFHNDYLEFMKEDTGSYPTDEYQDSTYDIKTEIIDTRVNDFESSLSSELETFLKDYKDIGTDEKLSLKEKKLGLINTMNILEESIQNISVKKIKNEYKNCLDMTKEKIRHTETNRPRKLERLSILITNSKTNLIMQDSNNNIFYPILKDLLYARFKIEDMLKKDETLLALLKQVSYEDKNNVVSIDSKYVVLYNFSKEVRINQLWNYIISIFAKKYNSTFNYMSKLIKFFAFENPKIHTKSFTKPLKNIPLSPIKIHSN